LSSDGRQRSKLKPTTAVIGAIPALACGVDPKLRQHLSPAAQHKHGASQVSHAANRAMLDWGSASCGAHGAEVFGCLVIKRDALQLGARRIVIDERRYLAADHVDPKLAGVVTLCPLVLEPARFSGSAGAAISAARRRRRLREAAGVRTPWRP
jgi:hypothetical protein